MTLLNAPEYDAKGENRKRICVGRGDLIAVLVVTVSGICDGAWVVFSNMGAEHRVNHFFSALEAKDFPKAYGIYFNDPDWQQHPQKYDYTLKRFMEDWTTESPVKGAD